MCKLFKFLGGDELTNIGTSLTTITPSSTIRRVYLINTGTTTITIGLGANPEAGKQIKLSSGAVFNESISGADFRYKSDTSGGKLIYALLG